MSPIASDGEFSVNVETGGIVITLDGCADLALDRSETVGLARELATFGGTSILVANK